MEPDLACGRRGGSLVPLIQYSSPLSAAPSFRAVALLALASNSVPQGYKWTSPRVVQN